MADEIPPAPSEQEDASKAETIRITLPPKQEQAQAKRETVRISLPGKTPPPAGIAPKKETTKLSGIAPGGAPAAPAGLRPPAPPSAPSAPSAPKLNVPPPPRPPSAPGIPAAPGGAPKPAAPAGLPKPPAVGGVPRPTVPLKPAPAVGAAPAGGAPAAPTGAPAPLTQKAAAPKKETARITLPPEGGAGKPALPKATVKMQQTQPLRQAPAAAITSAAVTQSPALSSSMASGAEDGAVNIMSIAALIVSLISLALVYFAFSSASS